MSLTIQLVQILITVSSLLFMVTGVVVLFLIAFQATYYERLNRTRKRDGTIRFKGKSYYMVKDDDFLAMKRYIEFLEKVNAAHKRKY
jgi:hypothetical protein